MLTYVQFTFFPLLPNPSLAYMNWSSAMYGGIVIVSMVYFFVWGRTTYDGPVVLVKQEF